MPGLRKLVFLAAFLFAFLLAGLSHQATLAQDRPTHQERYRPHSICRWSPSASCRQHPESIRQFQ